MARSRRRNGGRGRNRGVLTVREASYALPIQEPCNFMELDFEQAVGETANSLPSLGTIVGRLPTGTIKFRVTSIVVDPVAGSNATNIPYELTLAMSGQHFETSETTKPLRVKFSNAMGGDGQWYRSNGTAVAPASFGGVVPTGFTLSNFALGAITADSNGATGTSVTDVHVRVAFTDSDSLDG